MAETPRSNRLAVRNPMVGDAEVMAEWEKLAAEHPPAAEALQAMLRRLSAKWREQAKHSWAKHKAPVASYQVQGGKEGGA